MIHAIWSHDKRAALKHVRFNLEWLQDRIGEARAEENDHPRPLDTGNAVFR